jgi:hypothetical protein
MCGIPSKHGISLDRPDHGSIFKVNTASLSRRPSPKARFKRIAALCFGLLVVWLMAAYVLIPLLWKEYSWRRRAFDADPRVTHTGDGHPGDPLNVALIGTEAQLDAIMKAARWYKAARLGVKSDLKIAADTVLSRPYDEAPVSSLYLFGRKEDLAFEQPVGASPRHRHHVRFWKTDSAGPDGRPRWIGSAVYDKGVGLSRTTGQITHVTAPDIDTERDYLFECLESTGDLADQFTIDGFHKQLQGRNGGGHPWHTDGDLYAGAISENRP